MNRRTFVKRAATGAAAGVAGAGAACAGAGEGGSAAVQTRPNVRWRLASSFPRGLDTLYGIAEYLGERLEALSGGRFTLRAYPAGEIVPAFEVMDAVQQGTVPMAHTTSYYYIGKNPALAFDSGLPFGLTARQQFSWLYEGGGLELVREVYGDFGIRCYPAGTTGTQMGGWFRREVPSAASLEGLKMRIPGLGGEVMSRLGVTVQVIPGGEIYPALERGAIDATEWVGPYDDEKLGFHRVASYYYYPGWWEPGPTVSFLVNQAAYDALPTEYQQILESATKDASMTLTARYDAINPPALERLIAEGVQLRRFSDDIMEAAHRASFEIYEEQAAADAGYRRVYDAWQAALREQHKWFGIAEHAYAQFAYSRNA